MKGKSPILVPVDFSEASEEAVGLAATMSACLQAPLVVAHVVHDPGDAPGYYHVKGRKKQLRRMEDVATDMLDDFIRRMEKRFSDDRSRQKVMASASRVVVVGLPGTRILELIEKLDARMVVMGSTGRTGLSRVLLGSKAEQVVRLSPVPVTIVKQTTRAS